LGIQLKIRFDAGGTFGVRSRDSLLRDRALPNLRQRPLRQVLKKVLGASALVVNDTGIVALLCEMRLEPIDQNVAVGWVSNLLGQVEIKAKVLCSEMMCSNHVLTLSDTRDRASSEIFPGRLGQQILGL